MVLDSPPKPDDNDEDEEEEEWEDVKDAEEEEWEDVKDEEEDEAELLHVNPSTVISSEPQAADIAAMRADLSPLIRHFTDMKFKHQEVKNVKDDKGK